MKLIDRPELSDRIQSRFRTNSVLLLLGPCQCGKTTLAWQFVKGRNAEYFDLESPADFRRLEDPMTARNWT
jgi:predicted AAA+ superfamily ATPase